MSVVTGSVLNDLQVAIFDILKADGTLMGKIVDVYDFVPDNTGFPYVEIGEATSNPFETSTSTGEEVTITIHIWSRFNGFKEANSILDDLNRLLVRKFFTINNYTNVGCYFDNVNTLQDPDGITRHIAARYRIQVLKN